MRILRLRNILTLALISAGWLLFAVSPELPRAFVNGKEYYYYDVKKGESIYKVAKQMGVSISDITSANPQALDGLRAGMRLYIPIGADDVGQYSKTPAPAKEVVSEATTAPVNNTPVKAEPVRPAPQPVQEPVIEAVREVAEAPSIPDDPAVTIDDEQAAREDAPAETARPTIEHKVKRGESLYGIAHSAGMSLADIIKLNPQAANGVSPGDLLRIYSTEAPVAAKSAIVDSVDDEELSDTPTYNYSLIGSEQRISERDVEQVSPWEEVPADSLAVSAPADTVSVALVLPFMLSLDEPTKAARLFTEFYEGFLLAARQVASDAPEAHIIVRAYDTAMSVDTVAALMLNPEVSEANIIIGPDNEEQLSAIASGMSSETYLFNAFNVKSRLYQTYPHIIQANIPHGDLYTEAVNEFVKLFPECEPVILSRYDGQADKDAFVSLLKERLDSLERGYQEITFRNLLQLKDLTNLPDTLDYVFVPVSGQRSEFAKFTEGLKRFAAERPDRRTALFGYPEWITFRGEYFNRLGENDATIYTRFYAAATEPARIELENEFKEEFGVAMLDAAPVQGILGYDTGMYLLTTAIRNSGDFLSDPGSYVGIQSAFHYALPESDEESLTLVNRAIFIVTFGPNGFVDKKPVL